jgi:hypothetical protein
MLNSIASENFNTTVVHSDWNAGDHRSLREFQSFAQIRIQPHQLCSLVELRDGQSKRGSIEFVK